jgi:GT2 family glycosyltransferase
MAADAAYDDDSLMPAACIPGTTLVVPSRNRPRLLADAVRSVLAGQSLPEELILMDQSDSRGPDLSELAAGTGCVLRHIRSDERGLSRGLNAAIRAASHPILAFIHDDCLVTPAWFGTIVGALREAGERTVVTGRVESGETETANGFVPVMDAGERPADYTGRINRDVLHPNNMAFFRNAVGDVGPFDEHHGPGARFHSAEDNDFGFRLLEAGYRIRYVPAAVVRHRAWRAADAYLPLRWAYGRGAGAFYMKYVRLNDRYMLRRLVRDVGRHLRRVPSELSGQRRQAAADVIYATAVLSGAVEWAIRRPS